MTVRFDGPWKQVIKSFEPSVFMKHLKDEAKVAMGVNTKILEAEVRKAIKSARTEGPANAFLTLSLKGGTTPLIDSGAMFKAVGSRVAAWNHAQVGIVGAENRGVAKAARIVHDGATIQVTEKMFGMFLMLHRLSLSHDPDKLLTTVRSRRLRELWKAFQKHSAGRIFPKVTRGVIVVPERPFLLWALKSDRTKIVYENFMTMVIRALVRMPGVKPRGVPKYKD